MQAGEYTFMIIQRVAHFQLYQFYHLYRKIIPKLTKLFEFVIHVVEAFSACWSSHPILLFFYGLKSARVGGTDHRWIWQKIQMTEDPICRIPLNVGPLNVGPLLFLLGNGKHIFRANYQSVEWSATSSDLHPIIITR